MGYLIKIACPACRKEDTFPLGYGRNDFEATAPKVLGFCEHCKTFQPIKAGDSCECGEPMDIVYDNLMREKGIKIIPCPICKSDMKLSTVGFWD